ncbi:MAG: hypothetical protein WB770_08650 [Acidimicrobiales bacterium]
MDEQRARKLLGAERRRVAALLDETAAAGAEDREGALEPGDMTDPAEPLVSEVDQGELESQLRQRLETIDRAEKRLDAGTYGRSVRSGLVIPDQRLEADPAAELTVEEAERM